MVLQSSPNGTSVPLMVLHFRVPLMVLQSSPNGTSEFLMVLQSFSNGTSEFP